MLYTWRKPRVLIMNSHLISKDYIIERKSIQLKVHHGWLLQLLQPLYLWGHLAAGGLSLLSAGTCWGNNSGRGLWHKVCDREVDITLLAGLTWQCQESSRCLHFGEEVPSLLCSAFRCTHLWTTLLPWPSNAAGYLLIQNRSKYECLCSFAVIF